MSGAGEFLGTLIVGAVAGSRCCVVGGRYLRVAVDNIFARSICIGKFFTDNLIGNDDEAEHQKYNNMTGSTAPAS